PGKRDSCT
ncbi:hypothetical protein CP061683_1224, partial [Chlamydia psittaci 06-1683]